MKPILSAKIEISKNEVGGYAAVVTTRGRETVLTQRWSLTDAFRAGMAELEKELPRVLEAGK